MFVSVFHIIGGIALGWVLRQILARQINSVVVFMLIWGSVFSLPPLIIGVSSLTAMHTGYLVLVEILILVAAISVTAFAPPEYLSAFASSQVLVIAFGGIFVLIGAGVTVATLREDLLEAILIGGVFALVGGVLFAVGLVMALKNR